jgi:arylsulfate sulfotransferase
MNRFLEFCKENILLIVPSIVVLLVLSGFLAFGLSKPESTGVDQIEDITILQQRLEEEFMSYYDPNKYDSSNPYIVLDPFEITPLSALMIFETETEAQFEIVVKGKEANGDLTYITPLASMQYIPIYGLYPNYYNTVEVYEYNDGVRGLLLTSETILTGVLPDNVTVPTTVDTTYDYFQNNLMLVVPAMGSYPMAVDYNGDIRWVLTKNLSFSPTLLDNGHLLLGSDRLIVDPYYLTGLYEIDYLGKIYRDFKIPGGYHHDVVELPSGNFMVLTNDFDGTVEDKIVEIDRITGEIVDTINLETLLPELEGMSQMWTVTDWFHNNSIDYDPTTDSLLLSGRHQDIVININRTTRDINYIIGDPTNWSQNFVAQYFLTPIGDEFEWQYAQHGAMFLPNGDVFLFDNGNNKSKLVEESVDAENSYSRGVIYRIDETNMTIEQIYQFGKELGSSFYSPYISNVNYYADGNYMIHSGGHGEINGDVLNIPGPLYEGEETIDYKSMTYEVLNSEVKFYMEINDNYYQAKRIQLYTSNTAYRTGRGSVIGELKETKQYTDEINIKFNLFDTVPEIFGVELIKESDRLMLQGQFDRNDEIYIKLVGTNQTLSYYVPTSKTDYTAMCTVTFLGDERFVTYYINETNIVGNYNIFLVINGREYNTYQHVTFN